jgi:hypothetical protein
LCGCPAFVNWAGVGCPQVCGVLRMDMMAMVSSMLAMQAAGTQQQIQTSIIKQNADAEKAAVQTLLGTANLAPGVGGNLNIAA